MPLRIDRAAKFYDTSACSYQETTVDGKMGMRCTLPVPPSANVYWRIYRNRAVLSKDGRAYQKVVKSITKGCRPFGDARLKMSVTTHFGTQRKRDIKNLDKALADALKEAGVYNDDEQIDDSRVVRGGIISPGFIVVEIEEL